VTLALLFVAISYWTGLQATEFRQNDLDSATGGVHGRPHRRGHHAGGPAHDPRGTAPGPRRQGLDAYRALIGAAGRLALSGTPVAASSELVEATESLAGLAAALQELSTRGDTR
jgi:hypothetical protein